MGSDKPKCLWNKIKRHGLFSAVFAVALVAGICYLSTMQFSRIDMTAGRKFTLHSKTENILRNLETPVTITVLYSEPPARSIQRSYRARMLRWSYYQTVDMLEEFEIRNEYVTVREVDLGDSEKVQEINSQYDIPGRCVIFKSDAGQEVIPLTAVTRSKSSRAFPRKGQEPMFQGEGVFTSALLRVTEGKKQSIYFLAGHGERPLEGEEFVANREDVGTMQSKGLSLSHLVRRLHNDNYATKPLNLAETGNIPPDCDLLVIAGPRAMLAREDIREIWRYLQKRDGRVLVMVDSFLQQEGDNNLNALLGQYGIKARIHALGMAKERTISLGEKGLSESDRAFRTLPITERGYAAHPVTQSLKNYNLRMAGCAPLQVEDSDLEEYRVKTLLTSVPSSWGETSVIDDMKGAQFDPDVDIPGPVVTGVVVEDVVKNAGGPQMGRSSRSQTSLEPEMVIFGSSRAFTDTAVGQNRANLYLALNAVNWLAGKQHLTGIPARSLDVNLIELSGRTAQYARWGFSLVLPLCIVITGVIVWFIRRR